MFAALDAALPLGPAAETLQAICAAVAPGVDHSANKASVLQPDHAVVTTICDWAIASPRDQLASSLASSCGAEPDGGSGAVDRSLAEPQRIDFACTLLRKLGEAAPGAEAVNMHRFVVAAMTTPRAAPEHVVRDSAQTPR